MSSLTFFGTLFVCATPIGNLQDVSLRLLETLKSVDLIAAEDTRITLRLLHHFGIKKPLVSYHQHSPPRRTKQLLARLRSGKSIALVCSAGTPGIADPGAPLVREALKAGVRVVPVPGPSAVTAALSVSGLDAQRFLFLGFLPRHPSERRAMLEFVKGLPFTLVLYEAPHRLTETLDDLLRVLGDRKVALCRELTKVHEEVSLTTLAELRRRFYAEKPLGEFTLVVEGAAAVTPEVEETAMDEVLRQLLSQGLPVKEAAREIAQRFGVPRSDAYRRALQIRHRLKP